LSGNFLGGIVLFPLGFQGCKNQAFEVAIIDYHDIQLRSECLFQQKDRSGRND
jgi:hypothetical protein